MSDPGIDELKKLVAPLHLVTRARAIFLLPEFPIKSDLYTPGYPTLFKYFTS